MSLNTKNNTKTRSVKLCSLFYKYTESINNNKLKLNQIGSNNSVSKDGSLLHKDILARGVIFAKVTIFHKNLKKIEKNPTNGKIKKITVKVKKNK